MFDESFVNTTHYIMLEGREITLRAVAVWGSFRICSSSLDAPLKHSVSSSDGTYPTYCDFSLTCLFKVQGWVCLVHHDITILKNYPAHRKVLNKYLFVK